MNCLLGKQTIQYEQPEHISNINLKFVDQGV